MRNRSLLSVAALALVAGPAIAAAPIEGDLLVTDSVADRLLRVRPSTGEVVQLGPAGQFSIPAGVTSTRDGIFVTDLGFGTVSSVNRTTGIATPLLLSSSGIPQSLVSPFGIDSDASGALYLYDTQPGRVVRLQPTTSAEWELEAFAASVPNFARGLSLTKDDDGNAVDVFFASISFPDGLWRLRIATDTASAIPDTPIGMGTDLYGVAALGDCSELLCTIAFTESLGTTTGACPCLEPRLGAFTAFAIFAGVATIYEFPDGRCPLGVAAASASEFYVATVADNCDDGDARIERIYDTEGGFASEVVAELPPLGGFSGTRPTAVAIVPEAGAASAGLAAWVGLGLARRSRSPRS